MRIFLNLLLIVFTFSSVFAQKKELKVKYGKISAEELAMKNYPQDPEASAVVLFNKGFLTHDYNETYGFRCDFENHKRIKIFKKSSYDEANVVIPHSKSTRVENLKATCYNMENGEMTEVKLEKTDIFEEQLTKNYFLTRFAIPAVREGSIIEYKYTLSQTSSIRLYDWAFQEAEIPTIWSEFEIELPMFIDYSMAATGWVPFTIKEESQKSIKAGASQIVYDQAMLRYVEDNIPALKMDEMAGSPNDYISKVVFTIRGFYKTQLVPSGDAYRLINGIYVPEIKSWNQVAEEMYDDVFEPNLKANRAKSLFAEITADKTTTNDKIAAIYDYVGKNFKIKPYPFPFPTQFFDAFLKNRTGSITELNLLIINLLRQADVVASPVLISTKKHGKLVKFRISPYEFDRVIVAFENENKKLQLLDIAGFPNPIGLLPEEDINEEGMIILNKKTSNWISLVNTVSVRKAISSEMQILETGGIAGKFTFSNSGYSAVQTREMASEKNMESYLKTTFENVVSDGKLSNIMTENLEKWQEPNLKCSFELATNNHATIAGNKIYLDPLLGCGMQKNPFINPERKFNIDLGSANSIMYSFLYKLPNGYKVEETPKPIKIIFGENDLLFEYSTEITTEQLKITVRQNFKRTYFSFEEYPDLRQFFAEIVKKMEEQVVLTKI
jgi:Domain of Unknown Function with PDB structure (DUF3857)